MLILDLHNGSIVTFVTNDNDDDDDDIEVKTRQIVCKQWQEKIQQFERNRFVCIAYVTGAT